eukprot:g942.t1
MALNLGTSLVTDNGDTVPTAAALIDGNSLGGTQYNNVLVAPSFNFTAYATGFTIAENGEGVTLNFTLASRPSADVGLEFVPAPATSRVLQPQTVRFTATDYASPHPVLFKAIDNQIQQATETIQYSVLPRRYGNEKQDLCFLVAKAASPRGTLPDMKLSVTIVDDEKAGIDVEKKQKNDYDPRLAVDLVEGTTSATFRVRLRTKPTAPVYVTAAANARTSVQADAAVNGAGGCNAMSAGQKAGINMTMTFTTNNWHEYQTLCQCDEPYSTPYNYLPRYTNADPRFDESIAYNYSNCSYINRTVYWYSVSSANYFAFARSNRVAFQWDITFTRNTYGASDANASDGSGWANVQLLSIRNDSLIQYRSSNPTGLEIGDQYIVTFDAPTNEPYKRNGTWESPSFPLPTILTFTIEDDYEPFGLSNGDKFQITFNPQRVVDKQKFSPWLTGNKGAVRKPPDAPKSVSTGFPSKWCYYKKDLLPSKVWSAVQKVMTKNYTRISYAMLPENAYPTTTVLENLHLKQTEHLLTRASQYGTNVYLTDSSQDNPRTWENAMKGPNRCEVKDGKISNMTANMLTDKHLSSG